jgi:hypothetical protein
MPEKKTTEKAKEDLRVGKAPSTAAGEFVKEEIEHVRKGKHGARSPQQAIAIGLSKARRTGIPVKPPARGKTSEATSQEAEKDYEKGRESPQTGEKKATRNTARTEALKHEPTSSASHSALSKHAKSAAKKRNTP